MNNSEIINDSMTSKEMLDILVAKNMEDARQAKKSGGLVCWSSSIAPCEFCEAMGIYTVYPENHVVGIAARKGAPELLAYAEQKGYNNDICGYARANLAYMDVQKCISEEMPLPDVVLLCNNICDTLLKWYENIAYTLNVPLLLVDVPFNHEDEVTQANVDYVKDQFAEIIRQLENLTGRPFDYEKFGEVMKVASQNANDWYDATALCSAVPSPLSGFDMFNYMALIVCMRGRPECGMTFRKLKSELEEKIKNKEGGLRGAEEKYRIMWDGIACWPYLSHTYKVLKGYGANMVGSTYPSAWALRYTPGNLEEMARAYTSMGNNISLKGQIDLRKNIITETRCDGVVMHLNRSCKNCDFLQYEIGQELQRSLGIPITTFDGDQADPRNYSKAQYETRIQALVEVMEQKKQNG
ncbi:2-hydroxyacyl-CoA dehydratase [Caproiciproducens sp. NJN-50]|uniref:2-hydroxyacyl-CoA dehydratase subunit D n=1 Tax=Acutalibacteraceae TaxID=3082771 RepID=UPI000FFE209B|nr:MULTISPECIES: 2-hydroxyacyl-CoA dehydratase family protein [Acutalibacteraceae]QAT49966.1 2-hydroxyacyl-CoA dehydratase [Caproiciproducens sp. NJN-50]